MDYSKIHLTQTIESGFGRQINNTPFIPSKLQINWEIDMRRETYKWSLKYQL